MGLTKPTAHMWNNEWSSILPDPFVRLVLILRNPAGRRYTSAWRTTPRVRIWSPPLGNICSGLPVMTQGITIHRCGAVTREGCSSSVGRTIACWSPPLSPCWRIGWSGSWGTIHPSHFTLGLHLLPFPSKIILAFHHFVVVGCSKQLQQILCLHGSICYETTGAKLQHKPKHTPMLSCPHYDQ
jgi:hypothetical protein